MLRVQNLPLSSGLEDQYGDAQVEIAVSLLVYRNAPFDFHEKEFFGSRIVATVVSQALSPCLHMLHKLRAAMGKRDGEYVLAGRIELDEGYFSTETPEDAKNEPLKRDRGSQRKSKVIVMAESTIVEPTKKGQKPRRVGYLKMKVIENLQKETINEQVQKLASNATEIDSDDSTSYVDLKDFVFKHNAQVIPKEKIGEVLPWGHIAISNSKRQILNTYHNLSVISKTKLF